MAAGSKMSDIYSEGSRTPESVGSSVSLGGELKSRPSKPTGPAADQGRMGVYDHLMRPSMGHRMQVELRESEQAYNENKALLHNQLAELRMDKGDLYTSSPPPSPNSSIKSWGDKGSQFSKAPDRAAQRARLAKLEQENSTLTLEAQEQEMKRRLTLPPIQATDASAASAHGEQDSNRKSFTDSDKKSLRFGSSSELKPPPLNHNKKMFQKKSGKQKEPTAAAAVVRKPALKEKSAVSMMLRLPVIYSSHSKRFSHWDSGQNHIQLKSKSTALEKSKTEEECRIFSQRSVAIPRVNDRRRMEIELPPLAKQNSLLTKVSFSNSNRNPPPQPSTPQKPAPVEVIYTECTPAVNKTNNNSALRNKSKVKDHFPQNVQKLPEFEDSSGDEDCEEDDDDGKLGEGEKLQLPRLPVARLSQSKLSKHNLTHKARIVPRLNLNLDPSLSDHSAANTGRSEATGATGATYMSQETLEWKGEYMMSGNPDYKNRMLAEILHVVRQRMHDNESDLRREGVNPRSPNISDCRADIMIFQGHASPTSGETTARTARQSRLSRPIRKRHLLVAGRAKKTQASRLQDYLRKLTTKRRPQEPVRDAVKFQLAEMPIREITQSSLGHRSTAKTTATTTAA